MRTIGFEQSWKSSRTACWPWNRRRRRKRERRRREKRGGRRSRVQRLVYKLLRCLEPLRTMGPRLKKVY